MFTRSYITSKISKTIKQIDSTAEVFLFGSRARHEEHKESDWDLLVLSNNPVTIKEEQSIRHKLVDIELEVEESFSVFVYNKNDWNTKHSVTPFFKNISKDLCQL